MSETLNMSQLPGYRTGGTVHIVINNQVGFTTSPANGRSSTYATDVARSVEAPIFHVNGDDPEAVVRVARLAFDYRQTFHKDVVVDLICYRRHGHSEVDDPSITQPAMYDRIDVRASVRKLYAEALVRRGDIGERQVEGALRDYQGHLERAFTETRALSVPLSPKPVIPVDAQNAAAPRWRPRSRTRLPGTSSLPRPVRRKGSPCTRAFFPSSRGVPRCWMRERSTGPPQKHWP